MLKMGKVCSDCCLPTEPTSLKEALEFCSGLPKSDIHEKSNFNALLAQIKLDVKDYYYYEHDFDRWNGSIAETIRKCNAILKVILGDDVTEDKTRDSELPVQCVTHCANTLEKLVPQLFGILYFLYFMWNKTKFSTFGGGGLWKSEKHAKNDENLQRWLTDEYKLVSLSKDKTLNRGFDMDDIKGSDTVESLVIEGNGSDWLVGPIRDGYLQRLMVPMIFVKEWHRGKTAHSLLFLKQFTHQLDEGTLKHSSSRISNVSTLLNTCKSCLATIQILFEKLYPVCKENSRLYHGTLRTDEQSFNLYYKWIKDNIVDLIGSLKEMQEDCKHWNQDSLMRGKSHGPFPWGFIFIEKTCDSGQNHGTLATIIDIVIVDLHQLKETILQPSPQMAATGEKPQNEAAASPSNSGYGTTVAIAIAIGALFFSICYVLNL